ncbi:hypothetical protein ACLB2K_036473 [Fragaria x ananassa]
MALVNVAALQFTSSALFKSRSAASTFLVLQTRTTGSDESEANCQNWKSKNSKQKNAEEDDQNNKFLFYGSTLQKSIRQDPHCSTAEAAKRVGEKWIKACDDLNVGEISSYDCNGFAIGERIQAFETVISKYGFLSR